MLENEKTWRSEQEIRDGLWKIWEVMQECVHNGCQHESVLPGGMKVKRRAVELYRKLSSKPDDDLVLHDHLIVTDWVNLYALAVNEEMRPRGDGADQWGGGHHSGRSALLLAILPGI